jgi:hypothetical protein
VRATSHGIRYDKSSCLSLATEKSAANQVTTWEQTLPEQFGLAQHQIPRPSRMLCAPNRQRHRKALYGPAGLRDPKRTQKFLSCFGPIRQHFALKRHLLRASLFANNSQHGSSHGAKSPKSPEIRPRLSEGCSLLPSFRLNLDKLTKPLEAMTQAHRHFDLVIRR